jgi:hypothetical protein
VAPVIVDDFAGEVEVEIAFGHFISFQNIS